LKWMAEATGVPLKTENEEWSGRKLNCWCCSKVFAWAFRKTPNIDLNSGQGWDLFWSDWREAFLISGSYGMGDPMAPSVCEGNSEGGGRAAE
jgi:hypothetical protein